MPLRTHTPPAPASIRMLGPARHATPITPGLIERYYAARSAIVRKIEGRVDEALSADERSGELEPEPVTTPKRGDETLS